MAQYARPASSRIFYDGDRREPVVTKAEQVAWETCVAELATLLVVDQSAPALRGSPVLFQILAQVRLGIRQARISNGYRLFS